MSLYTEARGWFITHPGTKLPEALSLRIILLQCAFSLNFVRKQNTYKKWERSGPENWGSSKENSYRIWQRTLKSETCTVPASVPKHTHFTSAQTTSDQLSRRGEGGSKKDTQPSYDPEDWPESDQRTNFCFQIAH